MTCACCFARDCCSCCACARDGEGCTGRGFVGVLAGVLGGSCGKPVNPLWAVAAAGGCPAGGASACGRARAGVMAADTV
eukprot:4419040-Prymnesium_polylepis.1